MIIIVAPYTYDVENGNVNLGASKKIRFVISLLSNLSSNIVLVNSAHNKCKRETFIKHEITIAGIRITEVIPPTKDNRAVGKLVNLFHAREAMELAIGDEKPMLFWFYNGYSFEMRFASLAHEKYTAPMVLEVEDWHFSRGSYLKIKPWFDFFLWRYAVRLFTRAYAINANVKAKLTPFIADTHLLPGVVSNGFLNKADLRKAFTKENGEIHIGYFGGLNSEKGADIVLELPNHLPEGYVVHVTGAGALSSAFEKAAKHQTEKLKFHGMVSDEELIELMSTCDVILNPHQPITEFKDGIFPFKVIEAIASARLLISTPLSFNGFEEIQGGVFFSQHSIDAFVEAILDAENIYNINKEKIEIAKNNARHLFGETGILASLKSLLKLNP